MYMEIANMTLEQVSRVTELLSQARLGAYMQKVGRKTYLYAVDKAEYESAFANAFSFDYV